MDFEADGKSDDKVTTAEALEASDTQLSKLLKDELSKQDTSPFEKHSYLRNFRRKRNARTRNKKLARKVLEALDSCTLEQKEQLHMASSERTLSFDDLAFLVLGTHGAETIINEYKITLDTTATQRAKDAAGALLADAYACLQTRLQTSLRSPGFDSPFTASSPVPTLSEEEFCSALENAARD